MELVKERRSYSGICFTLAFLLLAFGALVYAFKPVPAVSEAHAGIETSIENHIASALLLKLNCLSIEKDIIIRMDPNFVVQLGKNVAALSAEAQLLEKLAKQAGDADAAQKASDFKMYTADYSDWIVELTKKFEARGINIKPYFQGETRKVALIQDDIHS